MKSLIGFTFIETLVTISVLMVLTSIVLLYNRAGEKQIVLLREKAKLVQTILKARSASINTLITDEPICGYGVHFESDGYLIFKDRATDCVASDRVYSNTDPEELIEQINLPNSLYLSQIDVHDILFFPPNPTVLFDSNLANTEAAFIISTQDNQSSVNIKLNNNGQISE